MESGVVHPWTNFPSDPSILFDFAQAVEGLGYSHLVSVDLVISADGSHRPDAETFHDLGYSQEPFVLFGYLAGLTRRLELVTEVLVLPQRQTVLVAKQAAYADVLSQGRLRLGVGVRWDEAEFQALGEDYHTRGARLEEQIAVLRALWTQEVVTFHGRWHDFDAMGIEPLPVQRPIPIWLGGHAEATLKRVATIGDGWMPLLDPDDQARQAIERMHSYAQAAGRDPSAIGIEAVVWRENKTPEDWQREVEAWQALGATHVTFGTADFAGSSLEEHLEALRRFKEVADAVTRS